MDEDTVKVKAIDQLLKISLKAVKTFWNNVFTNTPVPELNQELLLGLLVPNLLVSQVRK